MPIGVRPVGRPSTTRGFARIAVEQQLRGAVGKGRRVSERFPLHTQRSSRAPTPARLRSARSGPRGRRRSALDPSFAVGDAGDARRDLGGQRDHGLDAAARPARPCSSPPRTMVSTLPARVPSARRAAPSADRDFVVVELVRPVGEAAGAHGVGDERDAMRHGVARRCAAPRDGRGCRPRSAPRGVDRRRARRRRRPDRGDAAPVMAL